MKNLLWIGVAVMLLTGCEKNGDNTEFRHLDREVDNNVSIVFNDTMDIKQGDCFYDPLRKTAICFDSVLTDSRCPVNVVCVWAGEATARFAFREQGEAPQFVEFRLHTDVIINNYQLSFIDLFPYPHTENPIAPKDYRARIVLRRK